MVIKKIIKIDHKQTKEYWIEFFKHYYGATNIKISKLERGWLLLKPTFSDKTKRQHFHYTAQYGDGHGGMTINYAICCPKCGRWFSNGWYQTNCTCGEEILSGLVYP
jgi:hypothetical protein